jgi:hypothetical protein
MVICNHCGGSSYEAGGQPICCHYGKTISHDAERVHGRPPPPPPGEIVTDFDAVLRSICVEPRDRGRWLVLCDHLEEGGYALGARLRQEVEDTPSEYFAPRRIVDLVCSDPDFGPRAGVLRDELTRANRLGRALRRSANA